MTKKILFIGHIYENTGWGTASRNYLTALNRTGFDIVARGVRPNKQLPVATLNSELQSLAEKDSEGSQICIQHLLPHLMDINGNFQKNIAIFVTETENWWHSGWHRYLNNFDEIWVPNTDLYSSTAMNHVTVNTKIVPHACNIAKYTSLPKPIDIPPAHGNFVFYWIGELNRRKRITALIQAFYLEFTRNEPVSLLLKVNKPGMPANQLANEITQISNEIKFSHKLYGEHDHYPNIIVIPDYIENIEEIHATGDCYLNSSFGEAWEQSAFDAMGYDKWVISSHQGGPKDYLGTYHKGYLIKGIYGPVFGMNETFNFLNTAREDWFHLDVHELQATMRHVYNLSTKYAQHLQHGNGIKIAKNYSYENVGKIMKDLICS